MRHRSIQSAAAAAALVLGSCGKAGFDAGSADRFVASCMAQTSQIGARIGIKPEAVAQLMSMYASPPAEVVIGRDFDPSVGIPVAGADAIASPDQGQSCAAMASDREDYANFSPLDALGLGINQELQALSGEDATLRVIGSQIAAKGDLAKSEVQRLRQAMDRYSPRGVTFRVVRLESRYVPTVVVEAANAVGRPITAFLMTIRLVEADGTFLGTGKVRFKPPVPLESGVGVYTVNLEGISGLDTRAVLGFSGVVRVLVSLDDLVVEGKPMLGDLAVPAIDRERLTSIQVVRSAIAQLASYVKGIRSAKTLVFG